MRRRGPARERPILEDPYIERIHLESRNRRWFRQLSLLAA
jgi:hypothetical protein